jgi:tetrahydromethanopterin S-methyltransferase subunit G
MNNIGNKTGNNIGIVFGIIGLVICIGLLACIIKIIVQSGLL